MDGLWRDVRGVAWAHLAFCQSAVDVDLEENPARPDEDRLVLQIVVLQAEGVAFVDVDHLADVAIGFGPMELVSPGLLHFRHTHASISLTMLSAPRPRGAARRPPGRAAS